VGWVVFYRIYRGFGGWFGLVKAATFSHLIETKAALYGSDGRL